MSNHLNTIIDKHNQVCNLQVVFVDIEKYSQRRTSGQVAIINAFTNCIKSSLDEVAKQNIAFIQANDINFLKDIILIPTGDGCAINFSFDGLHNVHLRFSELLMKKIYEFNISSENCDKFNSNGWCNCHNKFNVRVGVTEGKGLIYKDVNDNYNVAGNVINMAARLLSIAERNQVLFSEDAYKQIIDLVEDPNFSDKFLKLSRIRIKHDIFIDAYIYNPSVEYINGNIPHDIIIKEKMKDVTQKLKDAGMPMPNFSAISEGNDANIDYKAIGSMMSSLFDILQSADDKPVLTLQVPSEKEVDKPKKTRRSKK